MAGRVPRDRVSEFGCTVLDVVGVEPAQDRAVPGAEYVQTASPEPAVGVFTPREPIPWRLRRHFVIGYYYRLFAVARWRDQARAVKAKTGSAHHAFACATWVRIAVRARPATTRTATCQSSPTMKSYQKAPNDLSRLMSQ